MSYITDGPINHERRRRPADWWSVVVGNIGTVYDGPDKREAHRQFKTYLDASVRGVGRATGERVILFHGDEIVDEHGGDAAVNDECPF